MADFKVDEWLPAGWKVEIRVRKSGKKDKFYIDPASGQQFRSIKDIDRYLLTAKVGSSDMKLDTDKIPGLSKKKKSQVSRRLKKSVAGNGKKKDVDGLQGFDGMGQTRKLPQSVGMEECKPFFIDGPDQCGEGSSASADLNLHKIINSVQKEDLSSDAAYFSAASISALLGKQLSENKTMQNQVQQTAQLQADVMGPFFPVASQPADQSAITPKIIFQADSCWRSEVLRASEDWKSHSMENRTTMVEPENTAMENPGSPLSLSFVDLCSDPCIDFAIRTLTGAMDPAIENYFWAQLGSSRS
ncbi:hypothetical protein Nepgr_031407 [Nepenthes gracilis]|uniref:MBD domain-containing protein n=1 Tax=Nepenthes gracilis TaxID=150966 RepID=A0AAD3Y719_NEPGR|nr:hypothetical protein Nepgr_031407 [Nepenthes gracilis]